MGNQDSWEEGEEEEDCLMCRIEWSAALPLKSYAHVQGSQEGKGPALSSMEAAPNTSCKTLQCTLQRQELFKHS